MMAFILHVAFYSLIVDDSTYQAYWIKTKSWRSDLRSYKLPRFTTLIIFGFLLELANKRKRNATIAL
jgi:hypothetical protein